MGDAFKKVRTGDPLVIPAATFNTFIDAARDLRQRELQGVGTAGREFRQTGIVLVRNDTGADRQRFDILGVQAPLIRPTDNAEVFEDRVTFKGVQPKRRHTGRFAVLLEPLPDGAIGRGVVDGATPVRVEMVDECDRFAEINPESIDRLQSGVTGSAYLLWIQPKAERDVPGIAWTIARIGNPAEAPPCSSSSSGSSSSGSSSSGSSGGSSSGSSSSGSEIPPSSSSSASSSSASSSGSPGSSSEGSGSGSGSGSEPSGSGSGSGSSSDPGGSGSGSDPGGSGSDPGGSGSGPGGSNCFLFGTLVRLDNARLVPIERLKPGDHIASLLVPGLHTDIDDAAQFSWMSRAGTNGLSPRSAAISRVTLGEHDGFYLINGRIKATFEHPFLIRRGDETGFCSSELLRIGDHLICENLTEEVIESIERIDGRVSTVSLHVPGTNMHTADGVWVHNAGPAGPGSGGGIGSGPSMSVPGSSGSGGSSGSNSGSGSSSGKSSGSSLSSGSSGSSSSGSSSAVVGFDQIAPSSSTSDTGSSVVDLLSSFDGGTA